MDALNALWQQISSLSWTPTDTMMTIVTIALFATISLIIFLVDMRSNKHNKKIILK